MRIEIVLPQSGYTALRRWPRYKIVMPVRLITYTPRKVLIVQGRGSELNDGGMTVFAGIELSVNDQVILEFTPPYGLPIRLRCVVRYRREYTYGLEFMSENESDNRNIIQMRSILKAMTSPVS